jgi:hypothetical protein
MKKILKQLFFLSLLVTVFVSCKKDENKVYYEGGTNPVLTASATGPMVLLQINKTLPAIKFDWTNPNYQFTTGLSSQDVNYTLQVDTAGANFSSPNLKEQTISKNLNIAFNVGDFNLLFASWAEDIPHNFEFRVKSTINGIKASTLYSNVISMVITPYLDVAVQLSFTGSLYLIGSATPGGDATGWNNPVPVPSQKFTKVSSTVWKITIPLIGGKQYLVIPDNGSWSNKYAVTAANVTWSGGEFGYNKSDNFPGPPTSGTYTITLNFKTGKFSVTQ